MSKNHPPISGLYVVTNNINGMRYVGATKDLQRRVNEHLTRDQQDIQRAIKEFGIENFSWHFIEVPPDQINLLEKLTIDVLNTKAPNGYNHPYFSRNSFDHTDEARQKISESKLGVKRGKRPQWWTDKLVVSNHRYYEENKQYYLDKHQEKIRLNAVRVAANKEARRLRRLQKSYEWAVQGAYNQPGLPNVVNKNTRTLTCPTCGITATHWIINKYHLDNCRYAELFIKSLTSQEYYHDTMV